ncbi:MFS transporter [Gilvimarinus agarilyticus]|uniref:MFS transporter n=1 Tax=Gilvimarinus sp. 2_MG-2023 TaxID=3062666 RepID=UPI001C08FE04|nr:MFS transporter [Gilvimarinus sp. 2_MG-2023]MBU2884394.1 MFS transporter [Gilvimarinus agarilyticus]MDO6569530.1 MFS transporter [Gilvimarinus sp. 2_MG-2023]
MAIPSSHKLSLLEKSGYAMGDAAANLVWRGALAYLAVFYTDTLGISAAAAAILLLIVRVSDGITDIVMGMIADRTQSKHGKFRPWVLWSAPVLGLFMVLSFTAPDVSLEMKLVWAYFTYIGLTLAYTVNNVPYSALMGVMTPSHEERSVLSGYRFAGAFLGGVLVMGFTPDLVAFFGQGDEAKGYQQTMYVFAALLVLLCLMTFFTTKERVQPTKTSGSLGQELKDLLGNLPFIVVPLLSISLFFYYRNLYSGLFFAVVMAFTWFAVQKLIRKPESETTPSQRDLIDLLTNKPWLMILGLGFLTMLFNGIKYGVIAYYFKHFIHDPTLTGRYFIALLITSIIAALVCGYFSRLVGKKALFIASLLISGVLTGCISFLGAGDVKILFILGCAAEFFAAFMPVLVFSMLGDAADYSEWKHGRRATGLFYSAGTFIQKTGGGFAGALVLVVLGSYGYVGTDPSTIAQTTDGMILLMSWIPAVFAFIAVLLLIVYPLSSERMSEIEADLEARRAQVA